MSDLTIYWDSLYKEPVLGKIINRTRYSYGYRFTVRHLVPEPSSGVFRDDDDELFAFSREKLVEFVGEEKADAMIKEFEKALGHECI